MHKPNPVKFIKPSRSSSIPQTLDLTTIFQNSASSIVTNLLLDTNVLISMEKVVAKGNKRGLLKVYGLQNLIRLLERSKGANVGISPALGFDEMPPTLSKKSQHYYEKFCLKHLKDFYDAPDSIPSVDREEEELEGYLGLTDVAKGFFATPFSSLLCLNYIEQKINAKPIDKFTAYLDLVEDLLDCVAAKEAEIARYCFSPFTKNSPITEDIRKKCRSNFLKTKDDKLPTNSELVLKVAYNGACDLTLLNIANAWDSKSENGNIQDTWIVTQDKKLAKFCTVFHNLRVPGQLGKYAASEFLSEHDLDTYWSESTMKLKQRLDRRRKTLLDSKVQRDSKTEFLNLLNMANKAIAKTRLSFDGV